MWGVDGVALTMPVFDPDINWDHPDWKRGRGFTVRWTLVKVVPGVEAHVSVIRTSIGHRLRIDINPARVLDPPGLSLCPPAQVTTVLGHCLTACAHLISPAKPVGSGTVTRLDVSINLTVRSAQAYIHALWQQHITNANIRHAHINTDGIVEGYTVGNKNPGKVLLYDLHRIHPDRAMPGQLRYEVQARRDSGKGWLPNYGRIHTVAEVTPNTCRDLLIERASWAKLETPILLLADLLDADKLTALDPNGSAADIPMLAYGAVPAPEGTLLPTRRLDLASETETLSGVSPDGPLTAEARHVA